MIFKTTILLILLAFFSSATSQIIGGDISDENKIKHLALIVITRVTDRENVPKPVTQSQGGGSILNSRWILTCAHTFSDKVVDGAVYRPYGMTITAGTKDKQEGGQVKKVKVQMGRNVFENREMDTALIHLGSGHKIDMTDPKVQRADLLLPGQELPVGTLCMISGWGNYHRKENGEWETPRWAFQGEVAVKAGEACRRMRSFDGEKHLCVGIHRELAMASKGDSGTPVSCRVGEREEVVAGFVVKVPRDVARNLWNEGLSAAVDVRKVHDWIRTTMERRRAQRSFAGETLIALFAAAVGAAAFLKLRS